MTQLQGKRIIVGAAGLLVTAAPLVAGQAHATVERAGSVEMINAASLKSMESSWLAVSPICKARGFNADAVTLENKQASLQVQSIYAAFEA